MLIKRPLAQSSGTCLLWAFSIHLLFLKKIKYDSLVLTDLVILENLFSFSVLSF